MSVADLFEAGAEWANTNQGVVGLGIFLLTILFGWVSGIFSALRRKGKFSALRRKPKFKVKVIPGPSFCCTFGTGKKHNGYDVHRTGISLYLSVSNVGSAPSSLENVSIGYHWNLRPFSWLWIKNSLGWFWLCDQSIALADFQTEIGANIKFYPFLTQVSTVSGLSAETYLDVGRSTNGMVYFEQDDGWGGCSPAVRKGKVQIKVDVRDVFGKSHYTKFKVPALSLDDARKYNPAFGKTLAEINREPLPQDLSSDNRTC